MAQDEVNPRLGRIRDARRARAQRHATLVFRQAVKHGARALRQRGHISPATPKLGMGAGLRASSGLIAPGTRRVIVKARYTRIIGGDLGAARAHLKYIVRDGVTREGAPGRLYDATGDPDNRLVAAELEARWNRALTRVAEVEARIATHDRATPPSTDLSPSCFATLASDLRAVWSAPTTDASLKKRIVRTVIQEVVADIDDAAGEVVLLIHWMGGVHTELRVERRRPGQSTRKAPDIVAAVRQLVCIADDEAIAGILNRNKLATGFGNRWTRERVASLRSSHKIPVHRSARSA